MNIGIIGQGFVGTALGIAASEVGHEVIGIDSDDEKINSLSSKLPYLISGDHSKISKCQVVVLAVPTPLTEAGAPNLNFLIDACNQIKNHLSAGTLITSESTSFPGTLRNVVKAILGDEFYYAVAPERIDPGNPHWNVQNTPRLLGGLDDNGYNKAHEFYSTFCSKIIKVSSPEIAEFAKLLENTFRMVNIALVNEVSKVAAEIKVSMTEVISAAATKPFGYMPFFPSLGVGGHCIPVDPMYLTHLAEINQIELKLVSTANEINLSMPNYIVAEVKRSLAGDLKGKLIQLSGITYKSDVADLRESPAIRIISLLRKEGAEVIWHDDVVSQWNSETSQPIQKVDFGILAVNHSNVDFAPWREISTKVVDVSGSSSSTWRKFP